MANLLAPQKRLVSELVAPEAADFLRAQFGDSALAGIWTRDSARLSTAGTVACVDDRRCATDTGRILIPRVAGSYVSLGNQTATLGGLTKLSVLVHFAPTQAIAAASLVGRATATNDATTPFQVFISAAGLLAVTIWSGAASNTYTLAGALTPGTDYWVAVVYDGTQGTVANRLMLGVAPVTNGVPGAITLTASGGTTAPASLGTATTALTIGANSAGTNHAQAPIDTVGMYVSTALTQSAVNTETAANLSTASHRWTFDNSLVDSGTVGGWDGTAVGTGLAYCSDDRRWGSVLMGGGGAANPTWDATKRLIVTDGVAQFLRATGGTIRSITGGSTATCYIGSLPTTTAATKNAVWLSQGSTTRVLDWYRDATPLLIATSNNAATASLAGTPPTGSRLLCARRTQNAGNASTGIRLGNNAEATGGPSAVAVATPDRLTIGGSHADTPGSYADLQLAGLLLFNGDFSGKQPLVWPLAQSLGATV